MTKYDFSTLSPSDFELLSQDLLSRDLGLKLKAFPSGPDGGVDLKHAFAGGENLIVQCKHYRRSGFSKLKSVFKIKELKKLKKLSPSRYIVSTSVALTPAQTTDLFDLLSPYCKSEHDIYDLTVLNKLLRENPEVEKSHFKLWITSEPVMSRIFDNGRFMQSAVSLADMKHRLSLFVPTAAFDTASEKLQKKNVCILSGNPGNGKTTLAELLICELVNAGFQLVVVSGNTQEAIKAMSESNAKQVFYYDDFLGQFGTEGLDKNEEKLLLQLISSIARNRNRKFILTTREHVFQQSKIRYEKLANSEIDIYRFVVDCRDMSEFEKAKILANHLFFNDVPQEHIVEVARNRFYRFLIRHRNYNPRIVDWVTRSKSIQEGSAREFPNKFLAHLENPEKVWKHAFEGEISQASRDLLFVLASCGASLTDDLTIAFDSFHAVRSTKYNVPSKSTDFRDALYELDGSFVSIGTGAKNTVSFENPSILDFVATELKERRSEAFELLESAIYFEQVKRIASILPVIQSKDVPVFDDAIHDAIQNTIDGPLLRSTSNFPPPPWSGPRDGWRVVFDLAKKFRGKKTRALARTMFQEAISKQACNSRSLTSLHSMLKLAEGETWVGQRLLSESHELFLTALLSRSSEDLASESMESILAIGNWLNRNRQLLSKLELENARIALSDSIPEIIFGEIGTEDKDDLEEVERLLFEAKELFGEEYDNEFFYIQEAIDECAEEDEEDEEIEVSDKWHSNQNKNPDVAIDSLFQALLD